jgi:hypothetical protein
MPKQPIIGKNAQYCGVYVPSPSALRLDQHGKLLVGAIIAPC